MINRPIYLKVLNAAEHNGFTIIGIADFLLRFIKN